MSVARSRDRGPVVVARSFGDRHDLRLVDELNDFVLDQIDQRDHAFDRMGVAVILGVLAPVGNRADEPTPFLHLAIEIARGERVDLDQFDVCIAQSAPLHGAAPSGIGLDDLSDLEHLLERDRRLAVGMDFGEVLAPGRNLSRRQGRRSRCASLRSCNRTGLRLRGATGLHSAAAPSTSDFAGSSSWMCVKRVSGPSCFSVFKMSEASATSASLSGSRGWAMLARTDCSTGAMIGPILATSCAA